MSNKETILGAIAWVVRRVRDPLGVRKLFRASPDLMAEDLPGLDPAVRPVGSVPAE